MTVAVVACARCTERTSLCVSATMEQEATHAVNIFLSHIPMGTQRCCDVDSTSQQRRVAEGKYYWRMIGQLIQTNDRVNHF